MFKMTRKQYADMFGATKGDRLRLADTSLIIEVEDDLTAKGDEAKFGGGKSLRDGMGQACGVSDSDCPDTVITNAVIIDYTGIIKADVGIKTVSYTHLDVYKRQVYMSSATPITDTCDEFLITLTNSFPNDGSIFFIVCGKMISSIDCVLLKPMLRAASI